MSKEELVGAYQYCFSSRDGETVLKDLREICMVDEPLCGDPLPTDRELIHRAVWLDVYNYINAMVSGD